MTTNSNVKSQDFGVCTDLDAIDRCLTVSDKFLIDAGCGNMHLSKALAERGAHVLAIDPDEAQAKENQAADIVANVGFAETGADQIPVENQSIDGMLFSYSLHHIPADLYEAVFAEALRILKPDGFMYIIEPVASGELNDVVRLFHDEAEVRADAQTAINKLGVPRFAECEVVEYRIPVSYDSWEHFANRYVGKTFNNNYTEADVRSEHVRKKFLEVGEARQFKFESPMRVTWLRKPQVPA